ncbi:RAD52 motif-containing protein 1 isoform X2 [Archocentrus centrarchus]|uniref:RAD52 motif-containing protein 1 isoform X2 n=1 Tax=Archocentrus centrarchus TaxID=63155 RepID=UPI0011E9EA04|nr:RAD52 motif-containing protein 1 isoform X2 [Archocentrus centrarchus]
MEAEVLDFRVPVESNKTLLVWDIPPTHTEAHIHVELFAVFSAFGPLYLLKVSPNAPLHPPGFYALVKFYSAAHAATAQRLTDGRPLLHDSPLKVKLSSKQTPYFLSGSSRPLSHAHCLELANRVLGFNGWTSDIISLKELTEEEEEEGGVRQRRLKFGCLLQLHFPHHGQTTRGAAVLEDSFTCAGNGKVMVEVKQTPDQFVADDTEGVLQVNEFSWAASPTDEEEAGDAEWALTVS